MAKLGIHCMTKNYELERDVVNADLPRPWSYRLPFSHLQRRQTNPPRPMVLNDMHLIPSLKTRRVALSHCV